MTSTYYDALGLAPTATDEQLAQAHELHSTAMARRAWAVLADPAQRAAYDAQLQVGRGRWSAYVPAVLGAIVLLSVVDFAIVWHATHPAALAVVTGSVGHRASTGTTFIRTLTAPVSAVGTSVSHAASTALAWLLAVVGWVLGLPLAAGAGVVWRRLVGGQPRAARVGLAVALGLVAFLPVWMGPGALWLALVPIGAFVGFVVLRAHPRLAPVVLRRAVR